MALPLTPTDTVRRRRQARRLAIGTLAGPPALWLLLFFVLPFGLIVLYSFLSRSPTGAVAWDPTIDNYVRLFGDPVYLRVFWRSLMMGLTTTLITLLLGYPLAVFIVLQRPALRTFLLFLVLIPFWTNLLVRIYAWTVILGRNGLLNAVIGLAGGDPLVLLGTELAVQIGLVYGELPFMVLPIYAALARFDFGLLEAASDLGANALQAFWHIMLPLTLPGIAAGSVLVFIPTVGNYVIPALLGGNKVALIGGLLEQQFKTARNWPFGSAVALVVMLVLTVAVVIYFRTTSEADR